MDSIVHSHVNDLNEIDSRMFRVTYKTIEELFNSVLDQCDKMNYDDERKLTLLGHIMGTVVSHFEQNLAEAGLHIHFYYHGDGYDIAISTAEPELQSVEEHADSFRSLDE